MPFLNERQCMNIVIYIVILLLPANFKGDLRLMEKEPYIISVTFYEVIKLQSFKFSVGDVIPANVQNISPLIFSLVLWRKNYL